GLRPRALDRARPARPRRHGDDTRAAGPAGRGRHPRRRDAPRVRAAPGRDRIAVAPPPGRLELTRTGVARRGPLASEPNWRSAIDRPARGIAGGHGRTIVRVPVLG